MDFGAFPRTRAFDPSLAPIHPGSRVLLEREIPRAAADLPLFLGAPQWTIPGFCKSLEDYAEAWNAIELNTAFYRTATRAGAKTWADSTPEDFRFFVKLHQELSHEFSLWGDRRVIAERMRVFVEGWSGLGEKWGGSFLQLPPGLGPERIGLLEGWFSVWNEFAPGTPLFVEFRHEGWFADRQLKREAARVLAAAKVGLVCTDTPGRRDASHGTLTTSDLFVRFLGQSLESDAEPLAIDLERLDPWIDRIETLRVHGLQRAAFFLHTTDQFWVPRLTEVFTEKLRERGFAPGPWSRNKTPEPPQLSLF